MDSIEEIYNSIKLGVLERVSNPLTFALIASWSIINYEVFVIIFTKGDASNKLELITTLVFPTKEIFLQNGVYYPIGFALLYVFLYPFPAAAALWASIQSQNLYKYIRDGKLLSKKESKKILNDFDEIKYEYEGRLYDKDNEISNLRERLENFSSDNQKISDEMLQEKDSLISELQEKLFNLSPDEKLYEMITSRLTQALKIQLII